MALNLLLVEDDAILAAGLVADLRNFGHRITVACDGRNALAEVNQQAFDALILDRMLPKVDGITILRRLRDSEMTLPILMLSALGKSLDKVDGLEAGADDYVVKPVAAVELNARLLAMIRGRGWTAGHGDTLKAGTIIVSPTKFRAWRDGVTLDLAKIEFRLLSELVANADAVITRAMLLERIWGYTITPTTNLVDVHVRHLRLKLARAAKDDSPDPIVTIRGVGYMIRR